MDWSLAKGVLPHSELNFERLDLAWTEKLGGVFRGLKAGQGTTGIWLDGPSKGGKSHRLSSPYILSPFYLEPKPRTGLGSPPRYHLHHWGVGNECKNLNISLSNVEDCMEPTDYIVTQACSV